MPPHLTADAALAARKDEIRRRLRDLRSRLDPGERQRLSLIACGHILASRVWQRAKTVALYVAVRGEIDAGPLLENAWQSGRTVLLPACSRAEPGLMVFAPCAGPDALCPGPFNIPEPALPGGQADFDALAAACGLAGPAAGPPTGPDAGPNARPSGPDSHGDAGTPNFDPDAANSNPDGSKSDSDPRNCGPDSPNPSPDASNSGPDTPHSGPATPDLAGPPAPDLIIAPGLAFDRNGIRLGMGGGYYDRLLALPRHAASRRVGLAYSFQLVDSLPREAWDMPVHAVCTEKGLVWIPDPRQSIG